MRSAVLQTDREQTKSLKGQEARRTGRRLDPAIRPLLLVLVPYCICRLFFPVLHLILQKCLPNIFPFFQTPFSSAAKGTHDKMTKSKKSKDARSRTRGETTNEPNPIYNTYSPAPPYALEENNQISSWKINHSKAGSINLNKNLFLGREFIPNCNFVNNKKPLETRFANDVIVELMTNWQWLCGGWSGMASESEGEGKD